MDRAAEKPVRERGSAVAGVEDEQRGGLRREQDLLSAASITTFKLNGQFLALAEELARSAGLTAAWWQVLGAVMTEPLPVAGIARVVAALRALSAALDESPHVEAISALNGDERAGPDPDKSEPVTSPRPTGP